MRAHSQTYWSLDNSSILENLAPEPRPNYAKQKCNLWKVCLSENQQHFFFGGEESLPLKALSAKSGNGQTNYGQNFLFQNTCYDHYSEWATTTRKLTVPLPTCPTAGICGWQTSGQMSLHPESSLCLPIFTAILLIMSTLFFPVSSLQRSRGFYH